VGYLKSHRQRFAKFLSQGEREEVRSIQNAVIAELHRPPASHPFLHVSQEFSNMYLKGFEAVRDPYPERHDIWFRYASPEHISWWTRFILGKLPKYIAVAEEWPNQFM
jgi:hypothetical protein